MILKYGSTTPNIKMLRTRSVDQTISAASGYPRNTLITVVRRPIDIVCHSTHRYVVVENAL